MKTSERVRRTTPLDEATRQLAIAADYIETCGYHKRVGRISEA